MDLFNIDVINYISRYSWSSTIHKLCSTCKYLFEQRDNIFIYEELDAGIVKEKFINRYKRVAVRKISEIPKRAEFLQINSGPAIIKKGDIPNTVVNLVIHELIAIEPGAIPKSVEKLHLYYNPVFMIHTWGRELPLLTPGIIPEGVLLVRFGQSLSQDIKGCIPSSVQALVFEGDFEFTKNIPDTVNQLSLGGMEPKIHVPKFLTRLFIHGFCIRANDIDFPQTLTHLWMLTITDSHISKFPPGLKFLGCERMEFCFSGSESVLPKTLQDIEIFRLLTDCEDISDKLPPSLQVFKISFCKIKKGPVIRNKIASPITKIEFGSEFCDDFSLLPDTLEHLSLFGQGINPDVSKLPSSVNILDLKHYLGEIMSIPETVTHLILPRFCKNYSAIKIPSAVQILSLSPLGCLDKLKIPPKTEKLDFYDEFPIELVKIPETIRSLEFKFLPPLKAPEGFLYNLIFSFNPDDYRKYIPSSVKEITFKEYQPHFEKTIFHPGTKFYFKK